MSNTNVKNFVQEMLEMSDVDFRIHKANAKKCVKSFGILYSDSGKRMTISKALTAHLDLDDKACLCPLVKAGVLLLAKKLPAGKCFETSLSGKEKKTVYNAAITEYLVTNFGLYFSDCSSRTFTDISFEKSGDIEVAIIRLAPPIDTPTEADVVETEKEVEETENEEDEIELKEYDEGDAEDENS